MVAGFQWLTKEGPVCEEPMRGSQSTVAPPPSVTFRLTSLFRPDAVRFNFIDCTVSLNARLSGLSSLTAPRHPVLRSSTRTRP